MAFTFKNRRWAYDNIASGSATGQERIISGAALGEVNTTRHSLDGADVSGGELCQVQTTNAVWLGGGGDPTSGTGEIRGSTSNSSLWTSVTSWTSKFLENPVVGASTS